MSALTHRQRQCLDIIEGGIARNGVAPGYREIATAMAYVSLGSVHRVIGQLEARGAVRRLPGKARGLVVVQPGRETDALAFLDPDTINSLRRYSRRKAISIESGLADVARKFFSGVSA